MKRERKERARKAGSSGQPGGDGKGVVRKIRKRPADRIRRKVSREARHAPGNVSPGGGRKGVNRSRPHPEHRSTTEGRAPTSFTSGGRSAIKRPPKTFEPFFGKQKDEELVDAIILDDDVDMEVRPRGWWMTGTPGRNRTLVVLLVVVFLMATIMISYNYLIPRTDVEMRTVYHERLGGGGSGGGINVNFFIENKGTSSISGVHVSLNVLNSTGYEMANGTGDHDTIPAKGYRELGLSFFGNHYEDYTLIVHCSFTSYGQEVNKDLVYKTHEDDMNIHFLETVSYLRT